YANSIIDHASVAENCRIGPFARVRPDTILQHDAHIGNFVEIKGSDIGAGTITCNYDGHNKWPTVIEDDSFIGSGSMLVAPVRIGAGATIGAGSTITQNAPGDELTLTRAKQTTIAGWQRPAKVDAAAKAAAIEAALAIDAALAPPKK